VSGAIRVDASGDLWVALDSLTTNAAIFEKFDNNGLSLCSYPFNVYAFPSATFTINSIAFTSNGVTPIIEFNADSHPNSSTYYNGGGGYFFCTFTISPTPSNTKTFTITPSFTNSNTSTPTRTPSSTPTWT